MKKAVLWIAVMLFLTACGGGGSAPATEAAPPDAANSVTESQGEETPKESKDVYQADEEWVVDGLWKLTVHSAVATEERNEFADQKPAQVIIITYSYENLGYEDDIQDLFFSPNSVIDGSNKMGYGYPLSVTTYAQPTPPGASIDNAEDCWGLDNESESVKILFEKYDNDLNKHKATFEISVTK